MKDAKEISKTSARSISHSERYVEAVGRRKTSTARVRITPSAKSHFIVNSKDAKEYFQTEEERRLVLGPISKVDSLGEEPKTKWSVEAHVSGGGIHSQAEAVRHGIARALTEFDEELRGSLKKLGFLKRDPRAKERRKFGLKKARKAPQWSKR